MRFTKMHGIGNDFVVIDCRLQLDSVPELERKAVAICDRKFGVGADGMILLLPTKAADVRMRVLNSDGSEAEMCGNGIRCLAKYIFDHERKLPRLSVETLAGVKELRLTARDGVAEQVRVDMGPPEFRRTLIPMTGDDAPQVVDEPLRVGDTELRVTCLSMGNPHCVVFVDDVASYPVTTVGPEVERHEAFPNRTNVEFAQVLGSGEVRMRVWERGAGETLACGTGACAAVVAAAISGKTSRQVLAHLAGGDLSIDWTEDGPVFMTGPAAEVFEGEFNSSLWSE